MKMDRLSFQWDGEDRLAVERGEDQWIFAVDAELAEYCKQEKDPYYTLILAVYEDELECIWRNR